MNKKKDGPCTQIIFFCALTLVSKSPIDILTLVKHAADIHIVQLKGK
jgi:hypothetical protein